jgi:hypothetical protein
LYAARPRTPLPAGGIRWRFKTSALQRSATPRAAGIPEYWIIDPLRQDARFYQLGEDGTYRPAMLDANSVYTSREVPGFRLRVSWLWQRPLPTIDEAQADLPPS